MDSSLEVEELCMVLSYHQYKAVWDEQVGKQLQCQRENDIYAVAILKSGVVVRSHSPKNLIHLFFSHVYQEMGVVVAGGRGTKSELIVR